jgi:hypothetical protein
MKLDFIYHNVINLKSVSNLEDEAMVLDDISKIYI